MGAITKIELALFTLTGRLLWIFYFTTNHHYLKFKYNKSIYYLKQKDSINLT